ncbi:hypothetical protein [Candidatus Fukatsuia endosymbiont of Tuberolachnus salignus]|uniref:hypothetical protein n=1 Tax=Candidatus Fukatsuia endosymbiont of Tuberolachnus salignus TaxID=3077957 RepID=UPI00313E894A
MENLLLALYQNFSLIPENEDNLIRIMDGDKERWIFISEDDDNGTLTLFCALSSPPVDSDSLMKLLTFNFESEVVFGIAGKRIVAMIRLDPEASPDVMAEKFKLLLTKIHDAAQVLRIDEN